MYSLKKATSISTVVEDDTPDQATEFTDSDKSEHPNRDLMYLVFVDGTTTTVQPQSIDD